MCCRLNFTLSTSWRLTEKTPATTEQFAELKPVLASLAWHFADQIRKPWVDELLNQQEQPLIFSCNLRYNENWLSQNNLLNWTKTGSCITFITLCRSPTQTVSRWVTQITRPYIEVLEVVGMMHLRQKADYHSSICWTKTGSCITCMTLCKSNTQAVSRWVTQTTRTNFEFCGVVR